MSTAPKARVRSELPGPVLDVRELRVAFGRRGEEPVKVVEGLDLRVPAGGSLALVGESGSGKSVSMRAVLGLLPDSATVTGSAILRTADRVVDLLSLSKAQRRRLLGRDVGMVFQNAMEAMNPTLTLERQLTEHLLWHRICDRTEARRRAVQALGDVGIPDPERRLRMYPFQLSGGMRQRAMIAMAIVARPSLLIADEPTTAVDATVQKQILELLRVFRSEGTAIVMITHDLGVARYLCQDIVVLYAGAAMETASVEQLLSRPRHPYSVGLMNSSLDVGSDAPLVAIPGTPVDPASRPTGCAFRTRCTEAEGERCTEPQPLRLVGPNRLARCWRADEADPGGD